MLVLFCEGNPSGPRMAGAAAFKIQYRLFLRDEGDLQELMTILPGGLMTGEDRTEEIYQLLGVLRKRRILHLPITEISGRESTID